jgi:hypothetical protein
MQRLPSIERLAPDATGPVLGLRRTWLFLPLLVLPNLVPGLVVLVGVYCTTLGTEGAYIAGSVLVGLGGVLLLAWLVFHNYFIGFYPARCCLGWLRQRIDHRADALVKSDDPSAVFILILPREDASVADNQKAADVGLLVVDSQKRELRYEGDVQRWTVPGESIRSFRLQSIKLTGFMPLMGEHMAVILDVKLPGDATSEIPLSCPQIRLAFWTRRTRVRRAELLRSAIGNLVDPRRWPEVPDHRLRPLRPPQTTPEAADYDESAEHS